MPHASDIYGSVFERGTAVLLARVEHVDGQPIQQADLVSIAYSVSELDRCTGQFGVVSGHDSVSLSIDEVIYDALQTDPPWEIDVTGYNFRHEVDVTVNEAFPDSGTIYRVRYELLPVTGQRVVFRFQLQAI